MPNPSWRLERSTQTDREVFETVRREKIYNVAQVQEPPRLSVINFICCAMRTSTTEASRSRDDIK